MLCQINLTAVKLDEKRTANRVLHRKKARNEKRGLFKKTLFTLLILFVLGVVGGAVTFAVMVSDAPSLDESKLKTPYSSTIYDKNGKEIAEVGAEKRTYVSIDEIPDVVKEAFIATEDARFYEHHGLTLSVSAVH